MLLSSLGVALQISVLAGAGCHPAAAGPRAQHAVTSLSPDADSKELLNSHRTKPAHQLSAL